MFCYQTDGLIQPGGTGAYKQGVGEGIITGILWYATSGSETVHMQSAQSYQFN